MSTITMEKYFEAPSDRVFEVFTDFENAAENIRGIERIEVLTDGEVGVGTRFRETRKMFKREATEEMEIVAFEPGQGYTVHCESCGCEYEWTVRLSPRGSATNVEMAMRGRPLTFMARVMSPLCWLMTPMMKKCVDADLEDMRKVAETG